MKIIISILIIMSLCSVVYGQSTIINLGSSGPVEKAKDGELRECNWHSKNCIVVNTLTEDQEVEASLNRHIAGEKRDLDRMRTDKDMWFKFGKEISTDFLKYGFGGDIGKLMSNIMGEYYKGLIRHGMTNDQAFQVIIETLKATDKITDKIVID